MQTEKHQVERRQIQTQTKRSAMHVLLTSEGLKVDPEKVHE